MVLQNEQSLRIYVDENKTLIFMTDTQNPNYDEAVEAEKRRLWDIKIKELQAQCQGWDPNPPDKEPMFLTSSFAIELKQPYDVSDVSDAFKKTLAAWNKYPPYYDKIREPIELYLGIKNHKKASAGKREILMYRTEFEKANNIALMLPMKGGRIWYGVESTTLPDEATVEDYADIIMKYAFMDLSDNWCYKRYKKKWNLEA